MNRRPIALGLAAALALAGFSACSAPGNTPVAVSDPVSAATITENDPVSAALQNFDYSFVEEPPQQTEGSFFGPCTYEEPEPGTVDIQALVNRAAALFEWDTGKDFSEAEFTISFFKCEMAEGNGSMAEVSAIIPDSSQRHAYVALDAETQLPVYYTAGYFVTERGDDFEAWRQSWPQKAQGFCDASGLGVIQGHEFSAMDEMYGRSFWVTLESGDTAQFIFTQDSTAGTMTFINLSAIGGEEMVSRYKEFESVHP